MNYKDIKRLNDLISEYHWYKEEGLVVFINYQDCKEVFSEIIMVDFENYPECKACEDCISIHHFEDFLANYTTENIEDIFPKDEEI